MQGFVAALIAVLGLAWAAQAQPFRVPKADFARFVGVLDCGGASELCPGADQGFVLHGLSGEGELQDPASPELTKGGKIVVGFLEGKPFSWTRYSVDFPASRWKWIVLNELSSGDQNHVVLTQWRNAGAALEFVKVFPHLLPLALGETYVHSKVTLPDGSLLLLLKGEGGDAGVTLQDYRFLRLSPSGAINEVLRRTNRSEIPEQQILDRLNADEAVEAVLDSSLACDVVAGRKAPSGGPLIRCAKSRTKVLYTKSGPLETPMGKDEEMVDVWKKVKAGN